MVKRILYFFVTVSILTFSACHNEAGGGDFPNTKEFSKFPVEKKLDNNDLSDITVNTIGIVDFKVVGSYLVISTKSQEKLWEIYSLPQLDSIAGLLSVGGGPLEISGVIPMFETTFDTSRPDGHTVAFIPQLQTHKSFTIDITESIDSCRVIGEEGHIDNLPAFPVLNYRLPEGYTYLLSVDPEGMRVLREICKDGKLLDIPCTQVLNGKSVDNLGDIGAISGVPIFHPDTHKVAEVQSFAGSINVYDYSDVNIEPFSIIKCDTPADMESVLDRKRNNIALLSKGGGYHDYFTVIENRYDGDTLSGQSLLFFSWEGAPLGKINLPTRFATCADIDPEDSSLYILDSDNDQILCFDIGDFLSRIASLHK